MNKSTDVKAVKAYKKAPFDLANAPMSFFYHGRRICVYLSRLINLSLGWNILDTLTWHCIALVLELFVSV